MPDVLEWRQAPREILVQAVQVLAAGGLVAFPTDTCYVAAAFALAPEAVRRLAALAPAVAEAAWQLAVTGVGPALDWVPDMPALGQRLARRLWPGPLTLSFALPNSTSLFRRLPEPVVAGLGAGGRLALRAPCHEAILQVLQLLPGPLVFRSLYRGDGAEVISPTEITPEVANVFEMLVGDDTTYFARPASVVEMNADGWALTRPGVVTEEDVRRLSACQIVFVCTGNTCRSPLAEALCKKMLADQLACAADELPSRGYVIQSAGLSALPGHEASPEAVEIAREYGADLSGHRSQPLTGELLLQADHVLAMTAGHLEALTPHGLAMLEPPRLLSCEGEDVTDPIGAEPEVYRECARQIVQHLQRRLPEFRPL
jgi:protein-tyrosine phosphatase